MTLNERISLPLWKKIIISLISLFFIALQLGLFFILIDAYINYNTIRNEVGLVYIGTLVIAIIYVLVIISKPISTNYKLTWAILILLFPIPFCVLYTLNSTSRGLSKKKKRKIIEAVKTLDFQDDYYHLLENDRTGANLASAIKHNSNYPVYKNCGFSFFKDALIKHNDLVSELKNAKNYVLLEYFIVADGELMNEVAKILEDLGKNGVRIYILYDDIGSRGHMNSKLIKKISKIPNCKITNYEPLGISFNLLVNYRDHRKIAVIDGRVAYCGGDNLADEYIHKKERFGFWRDNCGKFEGKIVKTFVYMFIEMWYISTKEIIKDLTVDEKIVAEEGYVLAFGDGPNNDGNPAYDLFMAMIASAKKTIFISTPYFIIDDAMKSLLSLRAKCGVEVFILMPKIPDKKSVYYMSRSNYREILKAGGKIYEMTSGFNHAKNIIIDDSYAFIGTINMDYRSLFLHYECGVLIINHPEIKLMKEDFADTISVSEAVTIEKYNKRSIIEKIISFIFNLFSPLL